MNPDVQEVLFKGNKGEFDLSVEEAFDRHLKRLIKIVEIAKKEFPCAKSKEFISYVLQQECYWYKEKLNIWGNEK